MEVSFNQLKKLDVISLSDGKNLGKVCDIIFLWPENKIKGFFVTGCKGFKFTRQDVFIPISNVSKIGEDVVLVKDSKDNSPRKKECPPEKRRDCCPPEPHRDCCPPERHRDCCPPPQSSCDDRRNYSEYE